MASFWINYGLKKWSDSFGVPYFAIVLLYTEIPFSVFLFLFLTLSIFLERLTSGCRKIQNNRVNFLLNSDSISFHSKARSKQTLPLVIKRKLKTRHFLPTHRESQSIISELFVIILFLKSWIKLIVWNINQINWNWAFHSKWK